MSIHFFLNPNNHLKKNLCPNFWGTLFFKHSILNLVLSPSSASKLFSLWHRQSHSSLQARSGPVYLLRPAATPDLPFMHWRSLNDTWSHPAFHLRIYGKNSKDIWKFHSAFRHEKVSQSLLKEQFLNEKQKSFFLMKHYKSDINCMWL